ncbi:dienelactone hydrolase family protein [Granulosicoccaceae sp. 1_MG-2023]|nr:dienelactone hydrolase family protein [Granulosicoccaceae sp. 1_MG-2023]
MHTAYIDYQDGDTVLEGFFSAPESSAPLPGVLIAHAWGGRDGFVEDVAKRLAAEGYACMALDMYGKGRRGSNDDECRALITPFFEDRDAIKRRMTLALETLSSQEAVDATRIAAIGFCFGGMCVLDLARSGADVRGVVSFHGLLGAPAQTAARIPASVLVLHGHDDPLVGEQEISQLKADLTAAGSDWQFHDFGSTVHAFTNPAAQDKAAGKLFSEKANRRSWQLARDFLAEVLR